MVKLCIECGKKLNPDEQSEGFCKNCQVKINNDFRILNETFDDQDIFAEHIFKI